MTYIHNRNTTVRLYLTNGKITKAMTGFNALLTKQSVNMSPQVLSRLYTVTLAAVMHLHR